MGEMFRLPDISPVMTEAEMAWVVFLRDLHGGQVHPPTLRAVQALTRSLAMR
jgi:hypothetical protein